MPIPFRFVHDFQLAVASEHLESVQDETELKKEDLAVEFIEADKIDLDDIIREQIYLSLPMKLLCGSNVRGLCSRCGVNLNRETCKCSREQRTPGFSETEGIENYGKFFEAH
jgi:uncharacterized protein